MAFDTCEHVGHECVEKFAHNTQKQPPETKQCSVESYCLESANNKQTHPQATTVPDGPNAQAITQVVGIVTACSCQQIQNLFSTSLALNRCANKVMPRSHWSKAKMILSEEQ